MLVTLAVPIPITLKTTDIIASIRVINQAHPLPVNNPHANPNHASPSAIVKDPSNRCTKVARKIKGQNNKGPIGF